MDIIRKYINNLLTIEDQEEALTSSWWSFYFAKAKIPGSNFKALQAKACEDSECAYKFAENVSGADIQYCQEHACKEPKWAYYFARHVPGADIKYCQEHACKNTRFNWAYYFAINITGADKEYCFKHAFPEKEYGPNRWKSEYKKFIMQKACE